MPNPPPDTGRVSGLEVLGLQIGDRVRFRRKNAGRWHEGKVVGRERDGSVSLRDQRGSARALPIAAIEVRSTGRRGGALWEPVVDRAARTEQLRML
jgi:hypothetical protein